MNYYPIYTNNDKKFYSPFVFCFQKCLYQMRLVQVEKDNMSFVLRLFEIIF